MHDVYCSCAKTGEIAHFTLDEAGTTFSRRAGVTVENAAGTATSMPFAISIDERFLVAAVRIAPYRLVVFAFDAYTGSLRKTGTVATAERLAYLRFANSGRYLVGASVPGSLVVGHDFDPATGRVSAAIQVIADIGRAHSALFSTDDRFVHVAALAEDAIRTFRLNAATHLLQPWVAPASTRKGAGPRHLVASQNGGHVLCINEAEASVDVYAFDHVSGALRAIASCAMFDSGAERGGPFLAADLVAHPTAPLFYASDRVTSTIGAFRLDATGSLQRVDRIDSEPSVRPLALTADGRFLIAAGDDEGGVSVYGIDRDFGALQLLHRAEAGTGVNWLVTRSHAG